MKIQERPPELDAASSANLSALFLLETENTNLRRLVIELLEKNQQLREQLRTQASGRNPEISGGFATRDRVDPQAA
jgi:hypothetical protein